MNKKAGKQRWKCISTQSTYIIFYFMFKLDLRCIQYHSNTRHPILGNTQKYSLLLLPAFRDVNCVPTNGPRQPLSRNLQQKLRNLHKRVLLLAWLNNTQHKKKVTKCNYRLVRQERHSNHTFSVQDHEILMALIWTLSNSLDKACL